MWSPVVKVSARRSLAEIGPRGKRGPGHPEAESVRKGAPRRRRQRSIHPQTLTRPDAADTMPAIASHETRTRRFRRAEHERPIDLGGSQACEWPETNGRA